MDERMGVPDLTARARILAGLRRHEEAAALLRRAVSADPDNSTVHLLLGICLVELGRPVEALPHAERAASLAPEDAQPQMVLSSTYRALRRRIKAWGAARVAVRLAPGDAYAHVHLSHALLAVGRRRAARKAAERAVGLDPEAPEAYNALGLVALRERHTRAAEAAFRKALELDPEMPEALNNLGVAARTEGRMGEAVGLFASSARVDPRESVSVKNLTAISNSPLRLAFIGLVASFLGLVFFTAPGSGGDSLGPGVRLLMAFAGVLGLSFLFRRIGAKMRPRLLPYAIGLRGLLVAAGITSVFTAVLLLLGRGEIAWFVATMILGTHLLFLGPDRQLGRGRRPAVPPGAFRQRKLRRGIVAFAISLFLASVPFWALVLGLTPTDEVASGVVVTTGLVGVAAVRWAWRRMRREDSVLVPIHTTTRGNHGDRDT